MKKRVKAYGAARAGGALQSRKLNHTVYNQARAHPGPLAPGQSARRRPGRDHRGSGVRGPSRFLCGPR